MLGPDLGLFSNAWYSPGRGLLVQLSWFFVNNLIMRNPLLPSSAMRVAALRLFGANVQEGVVIKPGVRVKYPWRLSVGRNAWIGEDVWIDNLAQVILGANACLSQSSYLCTGNHDWSDPTFALTTKPITIGTGAWVGARVVICPGIILHDRAVATAGSVVTRSIPQDEIHAGNPAKYVKHRNISTA